MLNLQLRMFSSHRQPCVVPELLGSWTNLDFNKVDWLHQPGVGSEHGGVEDSPGGGNDLTSSPVDGVRVQGHVVDVEPDGSQVFVTHHTLGGQEKVKNLSSRLSRFAKRLEQLDLKIQILKTKVNS